MTMLLPTSRIKKDCQHTNDYLENGLPVSKCQVNPTKKWTSDLESLSEVMAKHTILGQ